MIQKYLQATYQDNGRGPDVYDCYGIVRTVRHEVFGRPLMPIMLGINGRNAREMTAAVNDCKTNLQPSTLKPGVIACGWTGPVCLHIAVVVNVDNMLWMLEAAEPGIIITKPRDFAMRYTAVSYHD